MKQWIEWWNSEEIKHFRRMGEGVYMSNYFARNPLRPLYYNPKAFYSPADGVITFAKIVDPKEEIIRVKGRSLTLRELMCNPRYEERSAVVHTFMTFYDVHINRVPTDGYLEVNSLPPLSPGNLPMVDFETELFKHGAIDHDLCSFFFYNQRDLIRVYHPKYNLNYYIVQIADKEVNVIAQFYRAKSFVKQGERISLITFGSSVVLVVPIKNIEVDLTSSKYIGYHVEAGLDPLLEIKETNK